MNSTPSPPDGAARSADASTTAAIDLEHVRILRPEPGDVIVYRTLEKLPHDHMVNLHRMLHDLFPRNRCGIIDAGGDLFLVRPDE